VAKMINKKNHKLINTHTNKHTYAVFLSMPVSENQRLSNQLSLRTQRLVEVEALVERLHASYKEAKGADQQPHSTHGLQSSPSSDADVETLKKALQAATFKADSLSLSSRLQQEKIASLGENGAQECQPWSHSQTRTHTHALTRTHSHTHTRTHSLTHTRSHTHNTTVAL